MQQWHQFFSVPLGLCLDKTCGKLHKVVMKCLIGEDTFTTKSGMILVHSNLTSIVLCHSFLTRSVKSDDFFLQTTVKGVGACVWF